MPPWATPHQPKRLVLVIVSSLLFSCHQRKPVVSDAQIQAIHRLYPGMKGSCLDKLKWGGTGAMPERADECFTFESPRRWKGVWINAFEGSQFCLPPVRRTCQQEGSGSYDNVVSLEFSHSPSVQDHLVPGGVYLVDFIGRRSHGAGTFGHMGVARNDIIVDRMISMKQLEAPPTN
jgi:hypothetical protein